MIGGLRRGITASRERGAVGRDSLALLLVGLLLDLEPDDRGAVMGRLPVEGDLVPDAGGSDGAQDLREGPLGLRVVLHVVGAGLLLAGGEDLDRDVLAERLLRLDLAGDGAGALPVARRVLPGVESMAEHLNLLDARSLLEHPVELHAAVDRDLRDPGNDLLVRTAAGRGRTAAPVRDVAAGPLLAVALHLDPGLAFGGDDARHYALAGPLAPLGGLPPFRLLFCAHDGGQGQD